MYEAKLKERLQAVEPVSEKAAAEARIRWDSLAKPIDGLGRLEEMIVQIAAIQGTPEVEFGKRTVVVVCADHGVTCEGITQTGREVTASVAQAIAGGTSTINCLARSAGADVMAADFGMDLDRSPAGILDCRVRRMTGNIAEGPAMTREEACRALLHGIELAGQIADNGFRILAAGEMGIGNTTASAAVVSVLCEMDPEQSVGRGAGLDDQGLRRKKDVVRRAVKVNAPNKNDPLDVLSKLGGLDIAGMAGLYLGGALRHMPVVIDGLISSVAALLAVEICPACRDYLLPSHLSREPAAEEVMRRLELNPVLDAGMKLGEGTGAVMLFPLLDAAASLYRSGGVFRDIGVVPYERMGDS